MLGNLFRPERRAIQATAWGQWPGDPSGPSWSGADVSVTTSLNLLTVFGCNQFIGHGISTLPVDTLRETADGNVPAPSPPWLVEPVYDLDPIAWTTQQLTSLLLAGHAFLHKDYDGTPGGPRFLTPLDPTKCSVKRVRGRKTFLVAGEEFTANEILDIPAVMFPGADRGMSPVEYARQMIGAGLSVEEFAARFFGQGAVMSGVIEDPGPLDPDKARDTAKIWARLHSGKNKAHLPGVLQGGATWKPTGVSNEQAQFLETRSFTSSQIAAHVFLLDPTEMGLPALAGSSLTYQNLEQRNARKLQVTFLPWIVRLEKAWSSLLPKPRFVKFNASALLRGDTLARYQAHSVGIQNEFMTPNEARQLEDLPPLPGGDTVIANPSPGGNPPGGAK